MKKCEIMIRNVPVDVRRDLKVEACKQGKPMQQLILDLIYAHLLEKRKDEGREGR